MIRAGNRKKQQEQQDKETEGCTRTEARNPDKNKAKKDGRDLEENNKREATNPAS